MRPSVLLFIPLLVAACTNGTSPDAGPLKIGIVSGNNQSAAAPSVPQLAQPVVGQLVRLPNGTVVWLRRAGDALLPPRAYAQGTVLNGSPVVGAVVCAAAVEAPVKLTPVVACTNTASDGTATFAFTHGTKAGLAKAVVQGMQGGAVVTFDTARATVTPGPVFAYGGWAYIRDTAVTVGQVLDFNTFPMIAIDQYQNIIPQSGYTFSYQRFNRDPQLNDAAQIVSRLVTVRGGDTLMHAFADGVVAGGIHLRIVP